MKRVLYILMALIIVFPQTSMAKTVYELNNWELVGTAELTKEDIFEGEYAVKISNPGESENRVRVINDVDLAQGKYHLEFYAKGEYSPESVKIGGNWAHKSLDNAVAEVLDNGWTKYTYTFSRIASNAKFNFTVDGNCDYMYIDNVSLIPDGTEGNVLSNSGFESVTETVFESHDTVKDIIFHRQNTVCSISWTNPKNNNISAVKLYKIDGEYEEEVEGLFSANSGAVNTVVVKELDESKSYMFRIELDINGKISDILIADNGSLSNTYIPTGWSTGRSVGPQGYTPMSSEIDTTVYHSGQASVKFQSTQKSPADNIYIFLTQTLPFENGGNYYVSFWMKADNAATVNTMYNWNRWDNDAMSLIGGTLESFDWKKIELSITGASASSVFRLTLNNKMTGLWVDDFEAYKLDENGEPEGENLFVNPGFEEDVISTNMNEVSNLKAVPGNGRLTFDWSVPKNIKGIRVYENVDDELKLRADLPSDANGVTVKNLENYENYTYVIKTVDATNGESEGREITSAPNPPDFEITDPVIYIDGEIAGEIKEGLANVKMSATNFKLDTETDVSLILVLYKDKEMIDCEIQKKTVGNYLSESANQQFDLYMNIPSGEGYSLDVLVWDSTENMEILR